MYSIIINNLQCDAAVVPGAEEVTAGLGRFKGQHDDFVVVLRFGRVFLHAEKFVDITCRT